MTIENDNNVKIKWKIHPLRSNWKVSIALIIFLIALCIAIYLSFNSLTFLLLSAIFLFVSLSSFFLPTTYIFQDNIIIIKSLFNRQSRRWDSFKKYYPDKNGVFLSPFMHQTRLENFRGLYIRLGNNRDEVLSFIEQKFKYNNGEPKK